MKREQEQVRQFMLRAGQDCPSRPMIPSEAVRVLRAKLHSEEAVVELKEAFFRKDTVAVLDSICDSLVVVLGTAVACGFTPEQVSAGFQEVMRSNMSKFIDGHRREDGKWMKGPSYSPPNLAPIIDLTTYPYLDTP